MAKDTFPYELRERLDTLPYDLLNSLIGTSLFQHNLQDLPDSTKDAKIIQRIRTALAPIEKRFLVRIAKDSILSNSPDFKRQDNLANQGNKLIIGFPDLREALLCTYYFLLSTFTLFLKPRPHTKPKNRVLLHRKPRKHTHCVPLTNRHHIEPKTESVLHACIFLVSLEQLPSVVEDADSQG
jgi:hypothetical protein